MQVAEEDSTAKVAKDREGFWGGKGWLNRTAQSAAIRSKKFLSRPLRTFAVEVFMFDF
jgi:hypothetical protein